MAQLGGGSGGKLRSGAESALCDIPEPFRYVAQVAQITYALIDAQQLYYLSDPTVVFITDDSDFKKRLKSAAPQERVLSWSELLAYAKRGVPLNGA
jgi:hypothetical protein